MVQAVVPEHRLDRQLKHTQILICGNKMGCCSKAAAHKPDT